MFNGKKWQLYKFGRQKVNVVSTKHIIMNNIVTRHISTTAKKEKGMNYDNKFRFNCT